MLRVTVPASEQYDEANEQFITTKAQTLQLEHSLVSLAKWESKWHKPFLSKDPKTEEESRDYIRCMTITQNVNPMVYNAITPDIFDTVNQYMEDTMTATWFNDKNRKHSREIVTAELIYYWMISLQIPIECEKWHLNRLLTLIHVCNLKNEPGKKMSAKEIMRQNTAINAARRAKLHSRG